MNESGSRPSIDTGDPLANPRHERFAQLVVSGLPQSRAYIQAGYAVSPASAEQGSSRLVKSIKVASRIEQLRGAALERVRAANAPAENEAILSAAAILARAWEIGQSNARDRVAGLALAAKAFPEFRDAPPQVEVKVLVVGESKL